MTNPIQAAIAFISNAEQRHGYVAGPLKAELMQLSARIADLESQLSAVGAGGVEPLRKQAVHDTAKCPNIDEPRGCWRVACQLGRTCREPERVSKPAAQGLDAEAIERATKKMAALFDYPWEHMPEQGREQMRQHTRAVIAAAQAKQGGA